MTLGAALRVLRSEGASAVGDRILDRAASWRRWRDHARRAPRTGPDLRAPVLNVLPTPPAPWLGGVQVQFLRRVETEWRARAHALLFPARGGYRLVDARGAARLPGSPPPPASLDDPDFEAAVRAGIERTGARAVHVEGAAGLPPASLLRLRRAGLGLVLTLHDFSLFCPRPHLLEAPAEAFCGYCQDHARCQRCLARAWPVEPGFQRRYREAGAELLRAADAVVYPSAFLRARFLALVTGLDAAAHIVIEPDPPVAGGASAAAPDRPIRHVALVGAVRAQKGARVFEDVVAGSGEGAPEIRWSAIGGGDPRLLERLRRLGRVSVRGYYRAGSLPALLRREGVDLALLLSITPESYGLTLEECRAARVPVVAFDHGAIAERVRQRGGGLLVPLAAGAAGIRDAVRDLASGRRTCPPPTADPPRPPGTAARAHLDLYRHLRWL